MDQWIGLRENLQETRVIFLLRSWGFSCRFSLKPIHWLLGSSRSLECWCCFCPSMAKALDVLIWEDHSYCGWASEILHHQKDGWNMLNPYKSWEKLTVNWCRISPHPRWRPFDGLIWAAAEGSGVVLLEITLRRPSTWSLWSRSSADGLMDFSR